MTIINYHTGFISRLNEIIEKKFDRNKTKFADAMGLKLITVRSWLKKDGASWPDANKIQIICEKAQISADWLLMGKGSLDGIEYADSIAEGQGIGDLWLHAFAKIGTFIDREFIVKTMCEAMEVGVKNKLDECYKEKDNPIFIKMKKKLESLVYNWKNLIDLWMERQEELWSISRLSEPDKEVFPDDWNRWTHVKGQADLLKMKLENNESERNKLLGVLKEFASDADEEV